MVENQQYLIEKRAELKTLIAAKLSTPEGSKATFRIEGMRNGLTKVVLRRIIKETLTG